MGWIMGGFSLIYKDLFVVSEIFFEAGKRIEALRAALTQAQFAARVGVDRKTVGEWERGERLPTGVALLKLMTEFGADVNYILPVVTSAGFTPTLPPDEQALLDNYRNTHSDGREKIRQVSLVAAKSTKRKAA